MKVTVDVDCTPEEARRFMGLPDMSEVHDVYLEKLKKAVADGVTPESLMDMTRNWGPMSEAGLAMWRTMFEQMSGKT